MKILILECGGTIGSKKEEGVTHAQSDNSADFFIEQLTHSFPTIWEENDIETIETTFVTNIDSTDLGADKWKAIIAALVQNYDEYEGFVVTHGTNTMGYTSSALSFAIENLGKPIVITGAQIPVQVPGSDAMINLSNALRVVSQAVRQGKYGVFGVFGTHIMPPVRVKKTTEYDIEAFKTYNGRDVGRIRADEIRFDEAEYQLYENFINQNGIATKADDLKIKDNFDADILCVTALPDMPEGVFVSLVNSGVQGLILRAFGAGDLPSHFLPGLKRARELKVPVVVTTQCPDGTSTMTLNEIAFRSKDMGVIPAWDMSMESMCVKLRWMIGQGMTYEQICTKFPISIRGELVSQIATKPEDFPVDGSGAFVSS